MVIVALLVLEWSCVTGGGSRGLQKTVKMDITKADVSDTKARIVNVITKSGENFSFDKKDPAHFLPSEGTVVGTIPKVLTFNKADLKIAYKGNTQAVSEVATADGKVYSVVASLDLGDRIQVRINERVSIPFSDIQQVWIRKSDGLGSVVLVTVGLAASAAVAYFLVDAIGNISLPFPDTGSCPFIYSYDGKAYVLDAEPYGMAVSEGLKRTDWVELSSLREVDGQYRIRLANELDETQYTDELKIVAVDHAPGVKVAPDPAGGLHAFVRPVAPVSAVDTKGRDILKFVSGNDEVFWLSPLEEKSSEDAAMRDELVVEFPKPAGTKSAKLLANVWTTHWGSLSAGRLLRLFGSSLAESYADVDRHGPTYWQFLRWMSSEELYTMKVWVETPEGWKTRGLLPGGAPVITKDKACVLDVGDVPGDVLRIKLRPPVNFWMVNSLAVDYGPDSPVRLSELAAESAVDPLGRDVREALAATDGSYVASPNAGERTDLVFPAPPVPEGAERTLFVKASGYYRLHLDAQGEPQTEMIARVLGEPDFAARYSLREYEKWEAGLRAKAGPTR